MDKTSEDLVDISGYKNNENEKEEKPASPHVIKKRKKEDKQRKRKTTETVNLRLPSFLHQKKNLPCIPPLPLDLSTLYSPSYNIVLQQKQTKYETQEQNTT
jgi:hypothetical protein